MRHSSASPTSSISTGRLCSRLPTTLPPAATCALVIWWPRAPLVARPPIRMVPSWSCAGAAPRRWSCRAARRASSCRTTMRSSSVDTVRRMDCALASALVLVRCCRHIRWSNREVILMSWINKEKTSFWNCTICTHNQQVSRIDSLFHSLISVLPLSLSLSSTLCLLSQ